MDKDKITAMWEEDGDLMRIKQFFGYVYQNEDLKERIKQKTLTKISDPPESGIEHSEPSLQVKADKERVDSKPKLFSLLKSINGKRAQTYLKTFSAAAVVVFAVYLGSFLSDGFPMPGGMGSPKTAEFAQDQKAAEDGGFIDNDINYNTNGSSAAAPAPKAAPEAVGRFNLAGPEAPKEEAIDQANIQQKIIYTMEATLRVADVEKTIADIEKDVANMGGYISESRKTDREDDLNAYMTLRIPVKDFDNFKAELSQYGTVSNQHLFTDDVSQQYFDVETRLRSWEAQEERYLAILKKAETVEDILKIEDSLAHVRREMESLKGQLKYWDNRVAYSEVRLQIYPIQSNLTVTDPWQPVSIKSTILAAKNAVIKSVSLLWNAVNYLVVFVGYAIPVAAILALGWFGYRRLRKKKGAE